MKDVAMGIDGETPDPSVKVNSDADTHGGENTVIQYWKNFSRAHFRQNQPLDKMLTSSVREVIVLYSYLV
jgi:hypothetical protein